MRVVSLAAAERLPFGVILFISKDHAMKLRTIAITTSMFAALAVSGAAFAESPACGDPKDDSWMAEDVILEKVQGMGYAVDSIGVSDGNCYELTGQNTNGDSVITYLDPRSGEIVDEAVQ